MYTMTHAFPTTLYYHCRLTEKLHSTCCEQAILLSLFRADLPKSNSSWAVRSQLSRRAGTRPMSCSFQHDQGLHGISAGDEQCDRRDVRQDSAVDVGDEGVRGEESEPEVSSSGSFFLRFVKLGISPASSPDTYLLTSSTVECGLISTRRGISARGRAQHD